MSDLPSGRPGRVLPPRRIRQPTLLLILLLLPVLAWAKDPFWEEPAFAEYPLKGPGAAKGVVVYNHGNDDKLEEYRNPVQPYLRMLAADGWDVIKFARLRDADEVRRAEEALVAEIGSLRRRGYERVVLAGPSRGGWLGLMAATRVPVFAVIATSPGGFGTRNDGARRSFDELRVRLPRILPGTRVAIADFAGDPRVESVGGRGPTFARALEAAGLPHLVLDRPGGFKGHASGMTGRFARVYGTCLALFVDLPRLPDGFTCATDRGAAAAEDLPLPGGADSVPQRGLLGRWVGIYPNGDARALVVTADNGASVDAVWSWGGGAFGKEDRKPGYERLRCTQSGSTMACPRKAGLAQFTRSGGNRLKYQWIPKSPKERRLTMELHRPGQW